MSRAAGRSPQTEARATIARMMRDANDPGEVVQLVRPINWRGTLTRWLRDLLLPMVLAFGGTAALTCPSGTCAAAVMVAHGR